MNNRKLFEILGEADDALVTRAAEAGGSVRVRRPRVYRRAVLIAAVLAVVFSVSAAAAYRFLLPKGLEEALELSSPYITTVIDEGRADGAQVKIRNKTANSAGFTVTFEALVKGESMRQSFINGVDEREIIGYERTYAVFSIVREDGTRVLDPERANASDFGYIVSMKGYAPNPGMFESRFTFYDGDTVLYLACDVTNCLPFADRDLTISVIGNFVATQEIIRMDENGDPVFTESWKGLACSFPLALDPALADADAAAKYMEENPCFSTEADYAWSDHLLEKGAESAASGVEAYIGDNKWENSFQLRAGKIYCLDEYLDRRDMWRSPDVRLLTLDELQAAAMPVFDKIAQRVRAGELDARFEQQYTAEAAVPAESFPAEATSFTLPDGSICWYMEWNHFVRRCPDGRLHYVIVECESVPVEIEDTGELWNAYYACRGVPERNGLNGAQMVAYYLDGRDPRSLPRGDMDEETALGIYARDCDFASREDAVYQFLLEFAMNDGVFEVR